MEVSTEVLRAEERIALKLRKIYQGRGYRFFRLSNFERYDSYLENKRFLTEDEVITVNDTRGTMALNPDITLSIVKNIPAQTSQKVYYNENIFRKNRKTGDYRQINQIGLEVLGAVDLSTEVEILSLAMESLAVIGVSKIEISDSELLNGILELFPEDTRTEVLQILKNKNLQELQQLAARTELSQKTLEGIYRLMSSSEDIIQDLTEGINDLQAFPKITEALDRIREVVTACCQRTDFSNVTLQFDLSIVTDTNYYSGIIFRGFIENTPNAVLFGGRYDKLLTSLGKEQGAIGFGIYLEEVETAATEKTFAQDDFLNIALPKGRMGKQVLQLFDDAGLLSIPIDDDSRKLFFEDPKYRCRYFWVKPSDIGSYVEHGVADLGVIGRDVLLETAAEVVDLVTLSIGRCRLAVAGKQGFETDRTRPLKVATKYPTISRDYYSKRSQPIELIPLHGSIELAPIVGLADVIVDIVETGKTLEENDLVVLEEITTSSGHLVANNGAWRFKRERINELVEKVRNRE